jgi:hypothetical protein
VISIKNDYTIFAFAGLPIHRNRGMEDRRDVNSKSLLATTDERRSVGMNERE